ncbi:MAG: class I SAM-dependent methyltransferase [Halobacteriota archaeon]
MNPKLLSLIHRIGRQFGLNITRGHYYSPIPNLSDLNDHSWSDYSDLVSLNLDEKKQLELLASFVSDYKNEYELFPREETPIVHQYYVNNGFFACVDAEMLYCMIRRFKPQRIIEVGSGLSTRLIVQSIQKNEDEDAHHNCRYAVIDPFPSTTVQEGFPGFSSEQLLRQKAQHIPLSTFSTLSENDVLFIDSSHVLKTGSDVTYVYLEVLPRLRRGVIIHFHDIFLPAEYPKEWVCDSHVFFNEQYLLQAFLAFNNSFEVLWAGRYMHLRHPAELEEAFSSYQPSAYWPSSFWVRKID